MTVDDYISLTAFTVTYSLDSKEFLPCWVVYYAKYSWMVYFAAQLKHFTADTVHLLVEALMIGRASFSQ